MEEQAIRINKFGEVQMDKVCYWWAEDEGVWYVYLPRCGAGSLRNHTVVENADKTITVTPSILTTGHDDGKPMTRHGYLTNGKWKEV